MGKGIGSCLGNTEHGCNIHHAQHKWKLPQGLIDSFLHSVSFRVTRANARFWCLWVQRPAGTQKSRHAGACRLITAFSGCCVIWLSFCFRFPFPRIALETYWENRQSVLGNDNRCGGKAVWTIHGNGRRRRTQLPCPAAGRSALHR